MNASIHIVVNFLTLISKGMTPLLLADYDAITIRQYVVRRYIDALK